jgi:hypothetical protein
MKIKGKIDRADCDYERKQLLGMGDSEILINNIGKKKAFDASHQF